MYLSEPYWPAHFYLRLNPIEYRRIVKYGAFGKRNGCNHCHFWKYATLFKLLFSRRRMLTVTPYWEPFWLVWKCLLEGALCYIMCLLHRVSKGVSCTPGEYRNEVVAVILKKSIIEAMHQLCLPFALRGHTAALLVSRKEATGVNWKNHIVMPRIQSLKYL